LVVVPLEPQFGAEFRATSTVPAGAVERRARTCRQMLKALRECVEPAIALVVVRADLLLPQVLGDFGVAACRRRAGGWAPSRAIIGRHRRAPSSLGIVGRHHRSASSGAISRAISRAIAARHHRGLGSARQSSRGISRASSRVFRHPKNRAVVINALRGIAFRCSSRAAIVGIVGRKFAELH
tara:strand:+ start:9299 stop:9844 length:546 start_codon:yes stop_codon:yes gene_type:complete